MPSPEQDPTFVEQIGPQVEQPSADSVWQRAVEVFGDEAKAHGWMNTRRSIFDGLSPQEITAAGDPPALRHILEILIRIEHGMFS
jgi:uncharacterized protein (DUF2384 family)